MKRIGLGLVVVTGLAGCLGPVGQTTSSVLNNAQTPAYTSSPSQSVVPSHCLKYQRGGFGTRPPGCLKASVFADQVAYPHDLTHPHTPGPTTPRTVAEASTGYLQGTTGTQTATGLSE